MVADMIETWVTGWAVSRRTPPPVEMPWGHYIEVADDPAEVGRHVLPVADESLVRSAAASVTAPRTWMKMPVEPEELEPWLPRGWAVAWTETGHLMAVDLVATGPVAPEGYTATVETVGSVVHVRVLDAVGGQAAKGQLAMLGEAAVVDRVSTEGAHRRRGLGRFVMCARRPRPGAGRVPGGTRRDRRRTGAVRDAGLEEARDAGGVRLPPLRATGARTRVYRGPGGR